MTQGKPREIRIALIGYKGIGKMHSHGYRNVRTFFDLDVVPSLKVICGRNREQVARASDNYGWEEYSTSWRESVSRDDIDLVDVCTTNDSHSEISIAAAKAGKHVMCEKPLATSLGQAVQMLRAAESAGVHHAVSFNYRGVPAIQLAKQLIQEGELGRVLQTRARWLTEMMDPSLPLSWFYQKERSGYGASGDIGSHIIDLSHYLVGDIARVTAKSQVFVNERPLVENPKKKGGVDVDDAVQFLAEFDNGAVGVFEATRCAGGYRDEFEIEICGSKGTLSFNSNRLYELMFYSTKDRRRLGGLKSVFVGNDLHPYGENICPYGEVMGRSDLFIIQAYELLRAITEDRHPSPNFEDGVKCQAVLDAVLESSVSEGWERPDYSCLISAPGTAGSDSERK